MTKVGERDEPEPLIDFFKGEGLHAARRVIAGAGQIAAAPENTRASVVLLSAKQITIMLNSALAAYGPALPNRLSIRQTAPGTGGRPFHFSYSNITKGVSARGKAGQTGTPPSSSKSGKNSRESLHQSYTERPAALGQDGAANQPGFEQNQAKTQEWVAAKVGASLEGSLLQSEVEAQRYMGNPNKLPSLQGDAVSFGTIGDTLEERMNLWNLVYEHEATREEEPKPVLCWSFHMKRHQISALR